jgi:hypothetical protein
MPIVIAIAAIIAAFVSARLWYISIPLALLISFAPSFIKQGERSLFATYKMRFSIVHLAVGIVLSLLTGFLFSRLEEGTIGWLYMALFAVGIIFIIHSGTAKQTPEDVEIAAAKKEQARKDLIARSQFSDSNIITLYSKEQMVRYIRAKHNELAVKSISPEKGKGAFSSRDSPKETYNTSLLECTCRDFQKHTPAPCKHIYYLADAMGILDNYKAGLPSSFAKVESDYLKTGYSRDYDNWEATAKTVAPSPSSSDNWETVVDHQAGNIGFSVQTRSRYVEVDEFGNKIDDEDED